MVLAKSPTSPLKWLGVALLSDLLIYLCYRHTVLSPDALKWTPWAFSDWLVNYSAGFVRRGLAGYLIGLYARGQPAAPIVNMIVLANFATLVLATSLLLILSRRLGALAAILFMLVPGGLWSMQFGNEFYYRKELLFYVYIALICLIYLTARRTARGPASNLLDSLNCGLIAILSVALSFTHEAFLFIGAVPSIIVLYWIGCIRWPASRMSVALFYGIAMLGLFLTLMMFKGDENSARMIWRGLNPADRALISNNGEIAGGISAMGWSTMRELGETLHVVLKGTAWYYLLALAVSLSYILATTQLFCIDPDRSATAAHRSAWTARLFALCAVGVAPLFVVGADWGRWIVAINMMTIPLICAGEFASLLPFPPLDLCATFARIAPAKCLGVICGAALLLTALTFRIPECCLVGSGDGFTTAERQLLALVSRTLRDKSPGQVVSASPIHDATVLSFPRQWASTRLENVPADGSVKAFGRTPKCE
ncbi:hypothetical protein [uncultured Methylovirgula sp.]|uniref:hypothetical protein n=1 Tax=uncultured Methylovirgula sp. TaxID=1285960 RepID=UPI0026325F13|nr:hypothetical protein [uncultured Methylovirgula sp.]